MLKRTSDTIKPKPIDTFKVGNIQLSTLFISMVDTDNIVKSTGYKGRIPDRINIQNNTWTKLLYAITLNVNQKVVADIKKAPK